MRTAGVAAAERARVHEGASARGQAAVRAAAPRGERGGGALHPRRPLAEGQPQALRGGEDQGRRGPGACARPAPGGGYAGRAGRVDGRGPRPEP
eukprot:4635352-Pyramimonas_sp.AAC.1